MPALPAGPAGSLALVACILAAGLSGLRPLLRPSSSGASEATPASGGRGREKAAQEVPEQQWHQKQNQPQEQRRGQGPAAVSGAGPQGAGRDGPQLGEEQVCGLPSNSLFRNGSLLGAQGPASSAASGALAASLLRPSPVDVVQVTSKKDKRRAPASTSSGGDKANAASPGLAQANRLAQRLVDFVSSWSATLPAADLGQTLLDVAARAAAAEGPLGFPAWAVAAAWFLDLLLLLPLLAGCRRRRRDAAAAGRAPAPQLRPEEDEPPLAAAAAASEEPKKPEGSAKGKVDEDPSPRHLLRLPTPSRTCSGQLRRPSTEREEQAQQPARKRQEEHEA